MRLRQFLAAAVSVLILLTSFPAVSEQKIFDLSAQNIQAYTEYLCHEIGIRVTGTPEERLTADWISEKLLSMGYSPEVGNYFRTEFQIMNGASSENLGVVLNPDASLPLFTVVAHYDTVPTSAGARDNSASVAILLEMARYFAENSPIPGCELRLVFLGSEENGYHGAQAYVSALSEEDAQRHMGAFNMDISVASPSDGAQLVMNILGGKNADGKCVDAAYLPAMENTITRYVSLAYADLFGQQPIPVFYHGESDHLPFHEAGLESANICWRRVADGMPLLPASYHAMEDTPESLDYTTALTTGRCILRAVEMAASDLFASRPS